VYEDALRKCLEVAWSRETSADPANWTSLNPAWGQCAVTALVVQELLGGTLMRGKVRNDAHYWNMLPDGVEIDFTRQQFGEDFAIEGPLETRTRDYVLSFRETRERYELLRDRALRELASHIKEAQDVGGGR